MKSSQERRTYDSSGRQRAAAARRDRVIDAAAELFGALGYEGTSMPAVADRAGVSVAYLERLGTKADLFLLAVERTTVGPAQRTVERARSASPVSPDMTRDEFLDSVARTSAEWSSRSAGMWRTWGSSADPALQDLWSKQMAAIRAEWADFLGHFDAVGWWRTDVSRREQAATCWMLTMGETYYRMTADAGLTHDDYVAWVRRGLDSVLIAPE